MTSSQNNLMLDSKTIVSMMKDIGIHEYDELILRPLLEFNNKYVTHILKEAKSRGRLANKDKIDITDARVAILKEKDGTIPRSSPHKNTEGDINIIKTLNSELIDEALNNINLTQFEQKMDDLLPELTVSDIEEVIRSIQENQHIITKKFDVDSLLNDPSSL